MKAPMSGTDLMHAGGSAPVKPVTQMEKFCSMGLVMPNTGRDSPEDACLTNTWIGVSAGILAPTVRTIVKDSLDHELLLIDELVALTVTFLLLAPWKPGRTREILSLGAKSIWYVKEMVKFVGCPARCESPRAGTIE